MTAQTIPPETNWRRPIRQKRSSRGVTVCAARSAVARLSAAAAVSQRLQRQMGAATNTSAPGIQLNALAALGAKGGDSLEFKAALPPPQLPASVAPKGLEGLLASIDGGSKKKMTTIEKSRHDWGNYKEKLDESTRTEMERFAKDGYLEKQAFLNRTDARQADVARSNRRRGMGMRD